MKLKSVFGCLVAAAALGVFSVTASAATLAQVGIYDPLVNSGNLANSSEATEEAWIEGFLGVDVDYAQLGSGDWEFVTDGADGDVAFDFGGATPDYFLVKVGGGAGAGADFDTYLFLNDGHFNELWGYFNLGDLGDVSLENIGIISHTGITGGNGTVSEPGILGLFGVGLVLLGFMRRRAIA